MSIIQITMGYSNSRVGEYIGSAARSGTTITYGASDITGVKAGDILIVAASDDVSTAPTLSGWTAIYSSTAIDGTSFAGLWYKIATSSSVAVTLTSSSASCTSVMAAFRGVIKGTESYGAINVKTIPSAGNLGFGEINVIVAHVQDQTTSTVIVPSGYTEANTIAVTSGNQSKTTIGYKIMTSSGTESPGPFTGTATTSNFLRTTSLPLIFG